MPTTVLTGANSVFPYSVDTYEYANNYKSSTLGEEGDIVSAKFRNRLADSIKNLESELQDIPKARVGDIKISCVTKVLQNIQYEVDYYVTIPSEKLVFLEAKNSSGALCELTDPTALVHYQFGLRPTASSVAENPWIIDNNLEDSRVHFRVLNPSGNGRQGAAPVGECIVSIILMVNSR